LKHPLQPFSTEYVAKNRDSRLFTTHGNGFEQSDSASLPGPTTATAYEKAFYTNPGIFGAFPESRRSKPSVIKPSSLALMKKPSPVKIMNRLVLATWKTMVLSKDLLDALRSETPDNHGYVF